MYTTRKRHKLIRMIFESTVVLGAMMVLGPEMGMTVLAVTFITCGCGIVAAAVVVAIK